MSQAEPELEEWLRNKLSQFVTLRDLVDFQRRAYRAIPTEERLALVRKDIENLQRTQRRIIDGASDDPALVQRMLPRLKAALGPERLEYLPWLDDLPRLGREQREATETPAEREARRARAADFRADWEKLDKVGKRLAVSMRMMARRLAELREAYSEAPTPENNAAWEREAARGIEMLKTNKEITETLEKVQREIERAEGVPFWPSTPRDLEARAGEMRAALSPLPPARALVSAPRRIAPQAPVLRPGPAAWLPGMVPATAAAPQAAPPAPPVSPPLRRAVWALPTVGAGAAQATQFGLSAGTPTRPGVPTVARETVPPDQAARLLSLAKGAKAIVDSAILRAADPRATLEDKAAAAALGRCSDQVVASGATVDALALALRKAVDAGTGAEVTARQAAALEAFAGCAMELPPPAPRPAAFAQPPAEPSPVLKAVIGAGIPTAASVAVALLRGRR